MIHKLSILCFMSIFLVSCGAWQPEPQTPLAENTSTSQPRTILALWDSLTAGFGVEESQNYPSKLAKLLQEEWYNYKIINGWVSGDTSQNLLDRTDLYQDIQPEIVLLVIGGNDGLRGISTETLKENMQEIIDITSSWDTKIVLWGMDIPINLWLDYRADFRDVYQQIADENPEIYFLDFFLEGVAGDPRYNLSDRIHPNPDWYDIVVDNMYNFLEKNTIITK